MSSGDESGWTSIGAAKVPAYLRSGDAVHDDPEQLGKVVPVALHRPGVTGARGGGLFLALVFGACGPSTGPPPPPPPPPEPLPARENISGTYEGRLAGWAWRFTLADEAGALSGSYAIRTSSTGEFADRGTLTGSATPRPAQRQTQDVSITLAGAFVGAFTGTATGRSRLNGMIEYRNVDGSVSEGPHEMTLNRAGR